MNLKVDMRRIS